MLVAAIDRNKASEPDKYVERVLSTPKSLPTLKSGEPSAFRQEFSKRKGIILTNGDRRHSDSLNRGQEFLPSSPPSPKKERRHNKSIASPAKWNSQTHEIIVIAVEKDPSTSRKWAVGEEVVVAPSSIVVNAPKPSVPEFKRTAPMANKEEMDYIVSLSHSLRKKI